MITCRTASLEDLQQVLDWAADEGWNPGLDDAVAFLAADPQGFFIAEDQGGAMVAAISVVNHSDDFAFLGLYITRPEHRGKGYGLGLWEHALQHARARTVGLDGVEAQQDNYARSGFAHAGGTTRFSGVVAGAVSDDIRPATPEDSPALVMAEARASGCAKPAYIAPWVTNTPNRMTLVCEDATGIAGFCTLRTCREGSKIGPLVAPDSAMAERMIRHAAGIAQGPVTLDVPASATVLSELCQTLGLEAGFKTARMYRGAFEPVKTPVFAVTSLELG